MVVKTYDKNLSYIDTCFVTDVSIKLQPNKENSISFKCLKKTVINGAVFFELIDQEGEEDKRLQNTVGIITSIDKDNKVSGSSLEKYLAQISNIPDGYNWNLKNLKNVLKDHCYGFRQIVYSNLAQINDFHESYHVKTARLDDGNGEMFADTDYFFSSNNENELYYYSDGYVIYKIQLPEEARRQGLKLRWRDTVGTTTDISVQFAWSDIDVTPTSWSQENSPVRCDSFATNEIDGIDIPEGQLQYLYVRFNLKYDTGTISEHFPKGVNYENEITTVTEDIGNVVYYGKTAILYGFEVIYRVNTLISYGDIDIPEVKTLNAKIDNKSNLLDSLKAICEAYGYKFTITKTGENLYLNVYEDYGRDLTNDIFVSYKVNSLITRQDYKKNQLDAVDAYGYGSGVDRIHAFVKLVDNPINVGTFEDSEETDIELLKQKAIDYINQENDDLVAISFEYYDKELRLGDLIRLNCNDVVFSGAITDCTFTMQNNGFKKVYTIGLKQSEYQQLFKPIFDGSFIQVIEPPKNLVANRVADGWTVTWSSNYSSFILESRKDSDSIWQRRYANNNNVSIPYTEYYKTYEFRVYAIKEGLISIPSQILYFDSGKDTSNDSIIDGSADMDAPDKPTITECVAYKDYITINISPLSDGLKNTIKQIDIEINKGSGWYVLKTTSSLDNIYYYNRNIDLYPEKEVLSQWTIRCNVTNQYNKKSLYSNDVGLNTDNYGSWLLQPPNITDKTLDRTALLTFFQPQRSDGKEVYGDIRYKVQIKKVGVDTVYYKPSTNLDPLANELNYKDGNGYVESFNTYSQTLPLTGQDSELYNQIENTVYMYKVVAFNEAGESEPTEVVITALCTNIMDIVRAKETYKELYVTHLSAISTDVGVIKEGCLDGNDNNYWALSTVIDEMGRKRYQGAMRVGGANEYLLVTPIVENNTVVDYSIKMKAGDIEIGATTTDFIGKVIIYDANDDNKRLYFSSTGMMAQYRTDIVNNIWTTAGEIKLDTDNNLFITNDYSSVPQKLLPYPSSNSKVYHFNGNALDQNGQNSESLTCTGTYIPNDSPVSEECFDGSISKVIAVNSGVEEGVLPTKTLPNSMYRQTSQIYNGKLYMPADGGNKLEVYDLATNTCITKTLPNNMGRYTSQIYNGKLYMPQTYGTILEIYDLATDTCITKTLPNNMWRYTSQIYNGKLYMPASSETKLEIYDIATDTCVTKTLPNSMYRLTSQIYNGKLYMPEHNGTNLEIYDLATYTCVTKTLPNSTGRYTSQIYNGKLYMPASSETKLEIYDLATDTCVTKTLPNSMIRRTSQIYNGKLYMPEHNGTNLEIYSRLEKPVINTTKSFNFWTKESTINILGKTSAVGKDWKNINIDLNASTNKATKKVYSYSGELEDTEVLENFEYQKPTSMVKTLTITGKTEELLFDPNPIPQDTLDKVFTYHLPFGNGLDPTKQYLTVWAKEPENVISNCFPQIGTVYTQYPDQPSPSFLYGGEWENISSNYAGCFFGVEGGNREAFGLDGNGNVVVQGDAIRNIYGQTNFQGYNAPYSNTPSETSPFFVGSNPSPRVWGGNDGSGGNNIGFDASKSVPTAEDNRPQNITVRIWKRIG